MIAQPPAHVLRLDHAPVLLAASTLIAIAADGAQRVLQRQGEPVDAQRAMAEQCKLCRGTRTCPDCGGPCEACTLR